MKNRRLARLLTLLAAILFGLGFASVAKAGICDIALVGGPARSG